MNRKTSGTAPNGQSHGTRVPTPFLSVDVMDCGTSVSHGFPGTGSVGYGRVPWGWAAGKRGVHCRGRRWLKRASGPEDRKREAGTVPLGPGRTGRRRLLSLRGTAGPRAPAYLPRRLHGQDRSKELGSGWDADLEHTQSSVFPPLFPFFISQKIKSHLHQKPK